MGNFLICIRSAWANDESIFISHFYSNERMGNDLTFESWILHLDCFPFLWNFHFIGNWIIMIDDKNTRRKIFLRWFEIKLLNIYFFVFHFFVLFSKEICKSDQKKELLRKKVGYETMKVYETKKKDKKKKDIRATNWFQPIFVCKWWWCNWLLLPYKFWN